MLAVEAVAARVPAALVEALESRMRGRLRESPILSAGLTSAGLAGPAGAEVGAGRVGAGVQRRSVQRQWARATVIRTTHPAMDHMRATGHMHIRRRHTEQITGQLCQHLRRMDLMQMEHSGRLE